MNSRLAWQSITLAALFGAALVSHAGVASAQAALDDDDTPVAATDTSTTTSLEADNAPHVGVGLRLRSVKVPEGLLELFVEDAPGGSSELGYGLEVARRKGNFEVQFGIEYDKIYVREGNWLDKGDMLPQDEVDHVKFDGFGWITAEVTFLNHTPIIKQLAIRYGGGAGIGIIKGEVRRTDYVCTSTDIEDSCSEKPGAENVNNPYDIPPVMLIVNAIIGVQITPVDHVFINIEGGLRTVPFFGASAGYYF
ncbi:MAG: hypothetical protein H6709_19310 [Kofleriaceae bacterium]|nr:hypothetical protein [Myxococcales bacterium]MCB9559464.1 hypothetical protein [Kofleriaceae bacterium]MCB9574240.1 hypothetical protein [Kofleriaceae bacterium]